MKTFKKMIIDDLKSQKRFDIIEKIVSIKKSNGSALNVYSKNLFLEQRNFLKIILDNYKNGFFGRDSHGNEDIYINTSPNDGKPRMDYVFLKNEFTENIIGKIEKHFGISRCPNNWIEQARFTEIKLNLNGQESFLN